MYSKRNFGREVMSPQRFSDVLPAFYPDVFHVFESYACWMQEAQYECERNSSLTAKICFANPKTWSSISISI